MELADIERLERSVDKYGLRFTVGHPAHGYSSVWLVRGKGDSYYVGVKVLASDMKISLHNTWCGVALTKEYHQRLSEPVDRTLFSWDRLPAPEKGARQVLSLIFPTNHLRHEEPVGKPGKPLFIFASAEPGKALEFCFLYSKENADTLERFQRTLNRLGDSQFRIGFPDDGRSGAARII